MLFFHKTPQNLNSPNKQSHLFCFENGNSAVVMLARFAALAKQAEEEKRIEEEKQAQEEEEQRLKEEKDKEFSSWVTQAKQPEESKKKFVVETYDTPVKTGTVHHALIL